MTKYQILKRLVLNLDLLPHIMRGLDTIDQKLETLEEKVDRAESAPRMPTRYQAAHQDIAIAEAEAREQTDHRLTDARDFLLIFCRLIGCDIPADADLLKRMSRLAGTTFLEASFILKATLDVQNISGDWCEYGVAHGRTSALLASALRFQPAGRRLWLYDSFEGLPAPHTKDILLQDIYKKGSMAAYEGELAFPEALLLKELADTGISPDSYIITKGWISPTTLSEASPQNIAFAYLDMDLYESTLDVLKLLVDRMPAGGIAILDDYGFFSEGVKTAVSEIMRDHPSSFTLSVPFKSKFAILQKRHIDNVKG